MDSEVMLNTGWERGSYDSGEYCNDNNPHEDPHDTKDPRQKRFGCAVTVSKQLKYRNSG